MDNFEKNLESIGKIQRKLADKLKEDHEELKSNYEIYYNSNGEPVLRVLNSNGDFIHYTSYYNPKAQAKEMISVLNQNKNRKFIICFGIGLGYQIDQLLETIGEKDMILVVEKNIQLLKDVLLMKDYSKYIEDNRLFFSVGELDDEFLKDGIARIIALFSFNIVYAQFIKFNIFDIEYLKYINEIMDFIIKTRDTYYFSIGNDLDDTLIGIKNHFDNIAKYIKSPSLFEFKKKFGHLYKDKPAIVIASGPSLNKNIDLLKEAKGKALLLACDASLASLKNHGIFPDTVGSVERIIETYDAFYKGKKVDNKIVLTAPAIIKKEILDTFDNKILSFFKGESIGMWFNNAVLNKGTVWCGASVAHLMFGLAHELGCNPIILIGQDLAYAEDGTSHASESEVKEKIKLDKAKVYVKGKNGKMIPSHPDWVQFLTIYNQAIRTSPRKVIDATEGGALIEGTEISTLREVIDEYCKEQVPDFRECVDSLSVDNEYIKEAVENLIKSSKELIKKFKKIHKEAKKALEHNERSAEYIKQEYIDNEKEDFIYNSIEYVENYLVREIFKDEFVRMYFQYLIYRAAQKISSLEETTYNKENIKFNLDVQEELLNDVIKFSEKIIEVYEKGIEAVKTDFVNVI